MSQSVTIKVPQVQVQLFNAILAKHHLETKLTPTLGVGEVIYKGDLEANEIAALNAEVNALGMGNVVKTVIGVAGKIANKIVNIGVNDVITPAAQEAGKVVASTAKTAGVGAIKIGASLFSSALNGFSAGKSEIASSSEWSEAKKLASSLFGSSSITIS